MIEYIVGVDGGGTGTRAKVARASGDCVLGTGTAGPSALGQGRASASDAVRQAIDAALNDAGLSSSVLGTCALGLGLSGVNHAAWRDEFLAVFVGSSSEVYGRVEVFTDGRAMLAGAHAGRPGVVLAFGTGSVGEVLRADGTCEAAGGWGFPIGDEGSGAWLGVQAVALAQSAMDGRGPTGPLARAVHAFCGQSRQELQQWCLRAGQFEYAQLAQLVFSLDDADPAAARLLQRAADEMELLGVALDPTRDLPLAVCGSVGKRLVARLPDASQGRLVAPAGDAADGALRITRTTLQHALEGQP